MIYPLLPVFLTTVLGASAGFIGAIEGAAESTAALLKLASGWWSDRVQRRKPLVVAGYALASIVRPLVALAQSATQVLLIRVSDRVGKGLRNAPRDALIADSVDPSIRGRAFGFRSAADNAGALLGPLIAFALAPVRPACRCARVFWFAAIPGAIAVIVAVVGVREVRSSRAARQRRPSCGRDMGGTLLGVPRRDASIFTLGNSTDAFLLLRAKQLGVPVALAPILWALLNGVKSLSNMPGGALSDRVGRRPALIAGWIVYAAIYLLFARATQAWHAWALFAAYGVYFGLTEGAELALVADVVARRRAAARRSGGTTWRSASGRCRRRSASASCGTDSARRPRSASGRIALSVLAAVGLLLTAVASAAARAWTAVAVGESLTHELLLRHRLAFPGWCASTCATYRS